MTTRERWDVAIKVLNGPLAGLGEQVYRGPVVRIGANPGPGGLQLTGYRGLDARHAVITAYDGGSATVGPVGGNQVRMAPHAHVNWKEIDPIRTPQYLSEGCALHLGPVGRGATLEFVACRRLGMWAKGGIQSNRDDAEAAVEGAAAPVVPPQAIQAHKVRSIRTSTAPFWFLGCMTLMTMTTVTVVLAMVLIGMRDIQVLEPRAEDFDFRDYARVDRARLQEVGLLEGLQQPFYEFVMQYNIDASDRRRLEQPEAWDQEFYDRVAASVLQHVEQRPFFRRLRAIQRDYAMVVRELQQENLPEVFAAIPYVESRYDAHIQSWACAKGYWQFMPEMAYRMQQRHNLQFRVRDCRFQDAPGVVWNPTALAPPNNVRRNAEYIADEQCRIPAMHGCAVDDRTDIERSTRAAMVALREPWDNEVLRASGALVQITIASHNAGYDDSRFGAPKRFNLLPAFQRWSQDKPRNEHPWFYGENIKCDDAKGTSFCGSVIPAETQHYVYSIVASHILAVCFYAANYSNEPAFSRWTRHTGRDGYCNQFGIPRADRL